MSLTSELPKSAFSTFLVSNLTARSWAFRASDSYVAEIMFKFSYPAQEYEVCLPISASCSGFEGRRLGVADDSKKDRCRCAKIINQCQCFSSTICALPVVMRFSMCSLIASGVCSALRQNFGQYINNVGAHPTPNFTDIYDSLSKKLFVKIFTWT